NGGANWTPAYPALGVQAFAIDPQKPGVIYAAVKGLDAGLFKTLDAGTTWKEADSGIKAVPIRGLALDPQNQGVIYGANGGTLFKTTDGGVHWTRGTIDAQKVVLDPLDSSVLYALWFSRQPAKSRDSGLTWSTLNLPAAAGDYTNDLAIDPQHASTVYVSVQKGVLKSVDDGATWSLASAGLPEGDAVSVLVISAIDSLTLYAGTYTDCDYDCGGDGLFKSSDGGASWIAVNSGLPRRGSVSLVAVDPQDAATVYLGLSWGGASNGLFKSVDGGANWNRLTSGLPDRAYGSLAIDPNNTSLLYFAVGTKVFRSADGGESWRALDPALPGYVDRVAIDARDSTSLYAATEAGLFVLTVE